MKEPALMNERKVKSAESSLALHAQTASELMTHNPVSIHDSASPREAAEFFYKRGVSAAPVIDGSGRAIGVLSLSDLVWFQRAKDGHFDAALQNPATLETAKRTVREIMTPAVFSVRPETPMREVLEEMSASKVHRLFVTDIDGVVVGVIAAGDVVRDLVQFAQ